MNTKFVITIIGCVGMVLASNVYSFEPIFDNGEQRKNHGSHDEVLLVESHSLNESNVVGIDKVKWERMPRIHISQADLEGKNRRLSLSVVANKQGIITDVNVKQSSGLLKLDEQAISAVKGAKIKPYQLNGKYYSFDVILPFEFYIE